VREVDKLGVVIVLEQCNIEREGFEFDEEVVEVGLAELAGFDGLAVEENHRRLRREWVV
jgi:hypothetical protein